MIKVSGKFLSLVLALLVFTIVGNAQLTGTKNIPGDYADLAAAIADLNTQGVGAGGVTLSVLAGNPQTSPAGGYVIGGTGSLVLTTASATNPIVIQGNGNSVTAPTTHTVGALNDGIFKLTGADWTTITGFTMLENAANTTTVAGTNNMTEWGVALLYVTATDGANNITITGNTIDLNRTYQNTFGIYANATHTATAVSTSATATGAAGGNSGLTITANGITDVNLGIVVVGPTAAADNNDGITIGGSAPNANTLTNFGTTGTFSAYANVSGTVNGILVRNSKNFNVSFNSITSSAGGVTAGTLNGIQIPASSAAPTGTFTNSINNNTISLQSGVSAAINGINVPSGSMTTTSTININSNNFTALSHTVAASATIQGIVHVGSSTAGPLNNNINGNTFTNITTNTTGSFTFISNSWTRPTNAVTNANNNSIVTQFTKSGAGGTVLFYNSFGTTAASANATETTSNNNFSNMTFSGATTITGWRSGDGSTSAPFGPNKIVQNNTFSNIVGGTSSVQILQVDFSNSGFTGNNVSGNIISNVSGGGTLTGIVSTQGSQNFFNNTISALTASGTGTATGILISNGATQNATRNKIYEVSNSNAGGAASGITVSGGTTTNLQNNLVGNITTPNANAANPLIGLNITGGTTVNVDFNTVYLNGTSSGALFGSSAVSVSTTPTVTLRNNIFANQSSVMGAGLAVAYRRSSTTLTTYGPASNNNDFFASTVYTDGTNTDIGIGAYKARVSPRDVSSFAENPPFLSTTGSSAQFLHINPAIATQIESGGVAVAGITVDFDGDTRAAIPDVGADEGTFTILDLTGPAISYTPAGNTTSLTNRNLTVTITDTSGIAGGSFAPRIYFRKNAGLYFSTQCTGSSPTYTCTIDYSLVGGVVVADVIDYFVVAQDTAGNISFNPSPGAVATNVNTVTTPPTTPNTYTIVAPFLSTVSVPGDYPSLTNTGGLFEAMNAGVFTGNTVVNITADLAGETGTVALNQLSEEGPGAGTYTVLIKPSGGPRVITGSSLTAIIRLNGADRVRIDGSTAASFASDVVGGTPTLREMTIENTNTGTSSGVILVGTGTNGAQNNTLRNLNVDGNAPTTTLVGISLGGNTVGTTGADNDNNRVENCRVRRAVFGIYSAGASVANPNTGTVISENQLDATGVTDRIGRVGIILFNDNGVQVVENSVGGILSSASADSVGIGLGVGAADGQFSNVAATSGGITNAVVTRNRINGIANDNSWGAAGIAVAGDTGGANTISNNMITGVISDATSPDIVAGIFVAGVTSSTTRLYYNSISMTGDRSGLTTPATGQQPSYGIAITGTDPTVELKNNVFYTTQISDIAANPAARSYSIGMTSAAFGNLDSNYNAYWSAGAQDGGFRSGSLAGAAGLDYATLGLWQTAVSDDANSLEADPVFINPASDLHLLNNTSPMRNAGTPIPGITVDHDNQSRPNPFDPLFESLVVQVDIGGDEFVGPSSGPADISGRVKAADGRGIRNVLVSLQGGNLPAPIFVRTSAFGHYKFEGIPSGQTYIVTVQGKRFMFENPTRVLSLTDSITDADFIGSEIE